MLTTPGADAFLGFGYHTDASKVLIDLVVKVCAIRDHNESPIAMKFPQYFSREEDHRIRFATALRMPEDAQPALIFLDLLNCLEGAIHTQILMVLGNQFDQPALDFGKQNEVLDNIY